jgi:murein DD-endopeptidase MepM/ murein hydrolase activator NlpD
MKHLLTKTYSFGKITITRYPHEYSFLYVGENKVFVKSISRLALFQMRRVAIIIFALVILSTGTFLTASMISGNSSESDEIAQDEKKKNSLLLSKDTDFSEENKKKPLMIRFHTVTQGETLSGIARDYGVSIDTICGSNNLRSYDLIHTGTMLRIPNKDGLLYKTQKKGNLNPVVKKYKIPQERILAENQVEDVTAIAKGTILFIPDAKPQNIIKGFMWPTASRRITSGFGWRWNPTHRGVKEFHKGIDIGCKYQWIRSTRYGKVTFTGWLGGYGKAIIVAHPGGYKSLYGHLSRIIVKRGQYVKQGQTIAKSGNTGRSTGAHLHFEIIYHGKHKNPYYYIIGK